MVWLRGSSGLPSLILGRVTVDLAGGEVARVALTGHAVVVQTPVKRLVPEHNTLAISVLVT